MTQVLTSIRMLRRIVFMVLGHPNRRHTQKGRPCIFLKVQQGAKNRLLCFPDPFEKEPENATQVSEVDGSIVKLVSWASPVEDIKRGSAETAKEEIAETASCLGVIRTRGNTLCVTSTTNYSGG